MKLYELKVVDDTDEVFAISLVESPAIQSDFIYFDKEEVQFAKVETEKRMLIGPILIPDRKILRIDGEGQPYHVFFSKDTVKKLAQNYLMKKYTDKATLEHDKTIKGVHLVESWIKEGKLDKSNSYGLSMPEGTWMGMFKVNDEKIWTDYVKTGKVKGFSVEALVEHELVKASMDTAVDELEEQEAALILSEIKYLIQKDMRYKAKKRIDMESYSDYGEGVRNNAKRAVEWADKNGWGSCGTAVGKIRASQLAKGEAISVDTIKRMHSFLSRHEVDLESSKSFGDGCGYLMYQAWGGKAGKAWARGKLRELGLLEEAAEIGPRGGIKESPKAPKSDTPNPKPKGEGTAEGDASGKRGAKVTAEQEKTLESKVKDFNERESNTKNGNATLGALKSVFQRGLGAFNVSHSPRVQSAEQWAYARVNAFLYLLKNGRPENPKYTGDYDLLPKGHPKADVKMEAVPSIPASTYPGEKAEDIVAPALLEEGDVNVDVYGYKTKFFQYCPGAQALFNHLISMPLEEDERGMVSSAAVIADKVFEIEGNVLNKEMATPQNLGEAITLVSMFKDIIHEVDEEVGMVHDVSFMDRHIQKIKSFLK